MLNSRGLMLDPENEPVPSVDDGHLVSDVTKEVVDFFEREGEKLPCGDHVQEVFLEVGLSPLDHVRDVELVADGPDAEDVGGGDHLFQERASHGDNFETGNVIRFFEKFEGVGDVEAEVVVVDPVSQLLEHSRRDVWQLVLRPGLVFEEAPEEFAVPRQHDSVDSEGWAIVELDPGVVELLFSDDTFCRLHKISWAVVNHVCCCLGFLRLDGSSYLAESKGSSSIFLILTLSFNKFKLN